MMDPAWPPKPDDDDDFMSLWAAGFIQFWIGLRLKSRFGLGFGPGKYLEICLAANLLFPLQESQFLVPKKKREGEYQLILFKSSLLVPLIFEH
jgi:hypothetical protein